MEETFGQPLQTFHGLTENLSVSYHKVATIVVKSMFNNCLTLHPCPSCNWKKLCPLLVQYWAHSHVDCSGRPDLIITLLLGFIGNIIKITLVKTVTIWLWRTKTGNFLGQKHWKKLHSNKINEQYRFLSETFCWTITYLGQILTKLRNRAKCLTFSRLYFLLTYNAFVSIIIFWKKNLWLKSSNEHKGSFEVSTTSNSKLWLLTTLKAEQTLLLFIQ